MKFDEMSMKKNKTNQKVRQNKKNAFSSKKRKQTKHKLEQLKISMKNMDVPTIISKHNKDKSFESNNAKASYNSLKYKKLVLAQRKDKVLKKQIEKTEQATENSMLKQIELMSDFTL